MGLATSGLAANGAAAGGGGGAAFTQGTFAVRPATPAANALYFATDTQEWWVGNAAGNAWQRIARVSGNLVLGDSNSLGTLIWGPGGVGFQGDASGSIFTNPVGAGFDVNRAGVGISVKEGANCKQGAYGPLVAGTLVVANTSVTASSRIFVCRSPGGTNPGAHMVSAITAATSFTVTSTSGTDTGSGAFQIFEPG